MKPQDRVNLYDLSTGKRVLAVVEELVGVGKSLAKILKLSRGSGENREVVDEVPHGADVDPESGDKFWLPIGETPRRGWKDEEIQPATLDTDAVEEAKAATEPTRRRR